MGTALWVHLTGPRQQGRIPCRTYWINPDLYSPTSSNYFAEQGHCCLMANLLPLRLQTLFCRAASDQSAPPCPTASQHPSQGPGFAFNFCEPYKVPVCPLLQPVQDPLQSCPPAYWLFLPTWYQTNWWGTHYALSHSSPVKVLSIINPSTNPQGNTICKTCNQVDWLH